MTAEKLPWSKRLDEIRALAGKIPPKEIIEQLGISKANLGYLSSIHKISLRMPKTKNAGATMPKAKPPKPPAEPKKKKRIELAAADLPRVKEALVDQTAKEAAVSLGVTCPELFRFCKAHGLKAVRKIQHPAGSERDPARDAHEKRSLTDKLDFASRFLRQHGYTVLQPCPFRNYVDRQSTGSLPRE